MKTSCIYFAIVAVASICNAAVLPLPNPSFESPDFADGSGLHYITPGLVFGWNWTGPANTQFGIVDPDDFRFQGTTGNGANRLPAPADGYQYAILGGMAGTFTSIQNPAPVAMIQPFTQYTFEVAAINEYAQHTGSRLGTLHISLLAGGNLVANSSVDYSSFDFGEMRLLQVSFTTGDSVDWTVRQDLNVRVSYGADSQFGSNGFFDNLALTATPVPEPETWVMLSVGLLFMVGLGYARRCANCVRPGLAPVSALPAEPRSVYGKSPRFGTPKILPCPALLL